MISDPMSRRMARKITEMKEFFDSASLLAVYETTKQLNPLDSQSLKLDPESHEASILFEARFYDLCSRSMELIRPFLGRDGAKDVFHISKLNIEDILRDPFPRGFRSINLQHFPRLTRDYLHHHLDLVDQGFHSARDERNFKVALGRMFKEGHEVRQTILIYEHSKDYWGIN